MKPINYIKEPVKPDILNGKLEFGNEEQIKSLAKYERELANFEDQKNMTEYLVDITFTGMNSIVVLAHNKKEAKEIAKEEDVTEGADIDDIEYDVMGSDQ